MLKRIDRKFDITASATTKKRKYDSTNSILFLAKDKALPSMLRHYQRTLIKLEADERQIKSIDLLIERVIKFQNENPEKIKVADVAKGKEEKLVNAPND